MVDSLRVTARSHVMDGAGELDGSDRRDQDTERKSSLDYGEPRMRRPRLGL